VPCQPTRVPNFPVSIGLGRTDRPVTWTKPFYLDWVGLAGQKVPVS